MANNFPFTFSNLEQHYVKAIEYGYEIMTCVEYTKRKGKLPPLTLVNRFFS